MNVLGIDIGGSGIKGAVVDVATGRLLTPRLRVDTPTPAKPAAVGRAVGDLVRRFNWRGPIGVGFPGIVRNLVAHSAANLHPGFVAAPLGKLFEKTTGSPVWVLNDADAAGLAEARFGAGRGARGTVLVLTLGTGIGSALFRDGVLVPNLEFGHLKFKDSIAEKYVSGAVRKREDLSWSAWGKRLNELLEHVHFIVSPDLVILGGGVSARFERFARYLTVGTKVAPATLENSAGIVGAALAAAANLPQSKLRVKSFTSPAIDADEEE